jgi:hypothetical protein
MTKQERLYNMFAFSVLNKIVQLEKQNLNLLDHDTFLSEYVVESAVDLGLLKFNEEDSLVPNEQI